MDGQSVKTTERGGVRGFDGHKRVKGRKRHILVDTLGLPIANRWDRPTHRIVTLVLACSLASALYSRGYGPLSLMPATKA
jgi:hypothetical protein